MSDSHTSPTPTLPGTVVHTGTTLWRQGSGVGAAVGFALSVALAIGIGPTRFPAGGKEMVLAQLMGIGAGIVIGAFLGLFVGMWVTPDDSAHHGAH